MKRPLRPCAQPGCPTLVEGGRCPQHRPIPYEGVQRPGARLRGYNAEWERERKRFLRENPACANCGQAATVVDHVTPHRGDPVLFWAESNWQPLCVGCHNQKTAKEINDRRIRGDSAGKVV